jgi:hypothetical protein
MSATEALRYKRLAATHKRKCDEWAASNAAWALNNLRLYQQAMAEALRQRHVTLSAYISHRLTRLPTAITLPRKWCRYEYRSQPQGIKCAHFSIAPARYATNKYVIHTKGNHGLKSRACRLADAITRSAYVGRSKGYSASAAQAEKFYRMYIAGWDAGIFGTLEAPKAA